MPATAVAAAISPPAIEIDERKVADVNSCVIFCKTYVARVKSGHETNLVRHYLTHTLLREDNKRLSLFKVIFYKRIDSYIALYEDLLKAFIIFSATSIR